MRPKLAPLFFVTALAVVPACSGFAQDQQPNQTPPGANTPQASTPQTASPQTPPGNDTQGAPPEDEPSQAAPKAGESTEPNQSVPSTQEQAPPATEAQPSAAPGAETPGKSKTSRPKKVENRKLKAKRTGGAKARHRPQAATSTSAGEPGKVVVRNGGATDNVIHLSPGGSQEQEAHNRENTAQLLATTDQNLKMLASRQLSPAEQSMVDQIHSYMRQARSAADSGDLARAHTLAFKAHLLSDDLAKP